MKLKFKKLFVPTVLMFSLLVGCSSESTEEAPQEKIIAATSGTLYPLSYHDSETNELTGYNVEVIKEVANRLDMELEFTEMAFDGMLTAVNSGQVDMADSASATEERKEKFAFSDPIKYSYGTAIVRKSDSSGINSLEDLKGKKAAGEATTTYMAVAREYGAEEVIYDNATNDQYLQDVANGRTDVILNDYYSQRLALEYYPDLDIMIHPTIKFNPDSAGIVMKKGNTELVDKVNGALAEMKEDGTMTELSEQFFDGADVTQEVNIEE